VKSFSGAAGFGAADTARAPRARVRRVEEVTMLKDGGV